jgi:hypothetical protein
MSILYFDNTNNGHISNTLEITLDGPGDLNVDIANLKYDKEHVLTFEIDDGLNDIYLTFYKLFKGDGIPEFDTTESNGFYFTDGCGNNLNYRGNINLWLYTLNSNQFWLEWSDGSHWLNENQTDIIVNNGNFGAYSHYFYKNAEDDLADPAIAAKSFINWHETRYGFRPLYVNRPGGVTFDDTTWINTWKDRGLVFYCMLSGDETYSRRLDNINFSTSDPLQVGRYSLENKTFNQMKIEIDNLMNSIDGNKWLSVYGHRVETDSFIYYDQFKEFVEYIDLNYGKNGSDNLWVPNINEIASYVLCRDLVEVNVTPMGNNKHIITIDDSSLPYYVVDRNLTLKLSSSNNVIKIKSYGFNTTHNNINMVNISWDR